MKPLIFLEYSVFEKKFEALEMGNAYTEKQNVEIQQKFDETKQRIEQIGVVDLDTVAEILKEIENDVEIFLHIGIVSYGLRRAKTGQKFLTDDEEEIWPKIQNLNRKLGVNEKN